MKRLLLSLALSEVVERIGLWLIIGGLIGEASIIFDWIFPLAWEKRLSFAFTVTIAVGVWIENIGASGIALENEIRLAEANARFKEAELSLENLRQRIGPRLLRQAEFLSALAGRPKAPVEIVYPKHDGEAFTLAMQLIMALQQAQWTVFGPLQIPDAMASPPLGQLPLAMSVGGQPTGVSLVTSTAEEANTAAPTPYAALFDAVAVGLGHVSGQGGGPAAPSKGLLRLVVGPKP